MAGETGWFNLANWLSGLRNRSEVRPRGKHHSSIFEAAGRTKYQKYTRKTWNTGHSLLHIGRAGFSVNR